MVDLEPGVGRMKERAPGQALVVGAGVGGLATALGLRRAGWAVTVLEGRSAPERYGTAFGIHPTAQTALDRLGMGEALRAGAVPYRDARIRNPEGKVLAALPLDRVEKKAGRPELLISRPRLIDALLDALDAYGDVHVRYGTQAGGPSLLTGDHALLVGADGINSTVRTGVLGERAAPRRVGGVAWIGVADFESPLHGETWGRGQFFGLTPIEPGRTNWYAVLPEATTPKEVRDLFSTWHDPIPRVLAATAPERWIRYELRHLHPALPSFVRTSARSGAAPVALVGDAAHAMTPHLGQGACTALLDAEALSRAVAEAKPEGLDAALRTYDHARRRPAQRVAFGSRALHRFMSTHHSHLRDGLMRALPL